MIKVTLEFKTEDELVQFFTRDRVQVSLAPQPSQAIIDVVDESGTSTATGAAETAAPRRRTRRTTVPEANVGAALAAVPSTPLAPAPAAVTPAPAVALTSKGELLLPEEVAKRARDALMPVFNKRGAPAVTKLLTDLGATRVTEVKADQLQALEAACAKALL